MNTAATIPGSAVPYFPYRGNRTFAPSALSLTQDQRRLEIQAMGKQIGEYVRFMCQVAGSNVASGEANEQALIAFYDRMVVMVHQLGRIQENLQLA